MMEAKRLAKNEQYKNEVLEILQYLVFGRRPRLRFINDEHSTTFGTIPQLQQEIQPLDYIITHLPCSEVGLSLGKWLNCWFVLIRALREIDRLSHSEDDYEEDEPEPEEPPLPSQLTSSSTQENNT
ncbi:hypothetical protein BDA99DRAFT_565296 [Phascolomyces articulosus]|uniref:Uncharacterized protein n=1 Tax=Phascolomyces articulosus TaxID=60185 RepID=A0AAD5JN62_9FUNG|nr:hypothetical protein BDA99DRAFT_565296 [Phascolomyces articulosus]